MTDPERALSEIEARANAATAGPWDVDCWETMVGARYNGIGRFCPLAVITSERREHDAPFIAHAREDITRLIAAFRNRAELAEWIKQNHSSMMPSRFHAHIDQQDAELAAILAGEEPA